MKIVRRLATPLALAASVAPAAASAQPADHCLFRFAEDTVEMQLNAAELGAGSTVLGSENITIAGLQGTEDAGVCQMALRVSKLTNLSDFPDYNLRASNRPISPSVSELIGSQASQINLTIPLSGASTTVNFQAVVPTEWGLTAGEHLENLQLSLLNQAGVVVDRMKLDLVVDIPKVVDVMFVGSTGTGRTTSVELGQIEQMSETRSEPFGVRIWSSSGYGFTFSSENSGSLRHEQDLDAIPYQLAVNGVSYTLDNVSSRFTSNVSTAAGGDLYRLSIMVPARRNVAGNYHDRLTVSVNAI